MPELPEVEITKRKMLPLVKNKTITDFWTDWPHGLKLARPAFVSRDIKGRKILDGHRIGKVIFLHLSGQPERTLAFHQRMSGRLEYRGKVYSNVLKNIRIKAEQWVRFVFRFSDGSELRFVDPRKFGIVWYGSPENLQKDRYLKTLGIDLQKLTFEEFREKIKGHSHILKNMRINRKPHGQIIKAFLLRQDVIAGVGNIIADESLWRAKINPKRKTSSLYKKEVYTLFAALKKTTADILKAGGTSMRNWGHPDGRRGRYQEFYKVYARAGGKCIRCGNIIKHIITAGRGTSFCSICQR